MLTGNRNGLVVAAMATQSSTTAEREAAITLIDRMCASKDRARAITLGSDQEEKFIGSLRQRGVVPHIAEYAPNPQ